MHETDMATWIVFLDTEADLCGYFCHVAVCDLAYKDGGSSPDALVLSQ